MKHLQRSDYSAVISILESNALVSMDIGPDDMPTFLGVMEDASLVAIGCLQTYGEDVLLRSVATDPKFRNRGYANSIVKGLESDAKSRRIRTIYLLTDTAASFFERLGYRVELRSNAPNSISTTDQFTRLCPDTAIFMAKNVDA